MAIEDERKGEDRAPSSASAASANGLVPDDMRSLDAGESLDQMAAGRAAAAAAEARVMQLAVHYADLHPVTPEFEAASAADPSQRPLLRGDVPGGDEPTAGLAGPGTPAIAAYAVEELGAVLDMPYLSALQLVADSIEVCYRLPRVWTRVCSGRVPAWRARSLARLTACLSREAVDFVDRQFALLADRKRLPSAGKLRDLVHEAQCLVDADRERAVEEAALASRGVWFDHQTSTGSAATTAMSAVLDAWDALDLDAALADLASTMGRLGDSSSVDERRASALALMAHPQRVLDLGDDPEGLVGSGCDSEASAAEATRTARSPQRVPGSAINLYVHVSLADLAQAGLAQSVAGWPASTEDVPTGHGLVEGLRPALLEIIRGWAGRCGQVVVRPVIDVSGIDRDDARAADATGSLPLSTSTTEPVDRHDPPPAMRELVVLRDGQCVFPGCAVDARRCDQDHIVPYVDPDEGGPPGQTRPANLACLCRRHHRLKTFTAWRYARGPDGDYRWTSPRGDTFDTCPLPKRGPCA